MKKKKFYLPPTASVVRVILEKGIATTCSPVKPDGILIENWGPDTMPANDGDIWLPI